MSFGILNLLEKAAMMAAPIAATAIGGPVAGAATGAALSGGRAALSGASPEQALMAAGTSGATSAIGAGAGALGGAAGEAMGEGLKGVGNMAGRTMANVGISALQGKSPQQIAMEQAQGLIPQGIQYLAQGGAVTPALYADRYASGGRVGYADGGMGDAMDGAAGGGATSTGMDMGGGWGDAESPGGYMGDASGFGGWMDANNEGPGPTSDGGGWGGAAEGNGAGIIESNPEVGTSGQGLAPEVVAPPPTPAALKPLPYIPPAAAPQRAAVPLLAPGQNYGFQNFNPAANPFGGPPVTAFAAGGRVGYANEGYVDFDTVDPDTATMFRDAGFQAVPLPPPPPPPAPERERMDKTGDWWDRNKKWAAPVGVVGGLTALGTLGSMLSPKAKAPAKKTREQLQAEYPMIPYSGAGPVAAPVGYRPGISPEWNYFPTRGYADGGSVMPAGERDDFTERHNRWLANYNERVRELNERNEATGRSLNELRSQNSRPHPDYKPTEKHAKGGGIGSLPGGEGVKAMEKDPEERGIHGRRMMDAAEAALNNNHPSPQDAISRFRAHFGDDALSTLMTKARRGDGMSDSLPATIDGRREAALASGEFVIPADIVSHLGNGSSEAGARELELMMARVRKARTGTAKQAPALKAGGLLPS